MNNINNIISHTKGKRVVFCSGNFHSIHIGHIRFLKYAKSVGDILVVGIYNKNNQNNNLIKQNKETLEYFEFVDYAISFNYSELDYVLNLLQPEFIVKGSEFKYLDNIEYQIAKFKFKLIFSSGISYNSDVDDHQIPNLDLSLIESFEQKYQIKKDHIKKILSNISNIKVLVIGDLIIDEYLNCESIGLSQESESIIYKPYSSKKYLGGAGFVAKTCSNSGLQTSLLTMLGHGDSRPFIFAELQQSNIDFQYIDDDSRKIILKQRYLNKDNNTVFRSSYFDHHHSPLSVSNDLVNLFRNIINNFDFIIFSDFSFGTLNNKVVNELISICKKRGIPFFSDSQTSSQTGNILKFKGSYSITPTEHEARTALNNFDDGLTEIGHNLLETTKTKNLFITLGKSGVYFMNNDYEDSIPAFNRSPVNVSGAGDTFLVWSSLSLFLKLSLPEAAFVGSIASALSIDKVANIPVMNSEILKLL